MAGIVIPSSPPRIYLYVITYTSQLIPLDKGNMMTRHTFFSDIHVTSGTGGVGVSTLLHSWTPRTLHTSYSWGLQKAENLISYLLFPHTKGYHTHSTPGASKWRRPWGMIHLSSTRDTEDITNTPEREVSMRWILNDSNYLIPGQIGHYTHITHIGPADGGDVDDPTHNEQT
jgi:hypothetical protein